MALHCMAWHGMALGKPHWGSVTATLPLLPMQIDDYGAWWVLPKPGLACLPTVLHDVAAAGCLRILHRQHMTSLPTSQGQPPTPRTRRLQKTEAGAPIDHAWYQQFNSSRSNDDLKKEE